MPKRLAEEWRRQLAQEVRSNLVRTITLVLKNMTNTDETRLSNLAVKFEDTVFNHAPNRNTYFTDIANIMYNLKAKSATRKTTPSPPNTTSGPSITTWEIPINKSSISSTLTQGPSNTYDAIPQTQTQMQHMQQQMQQIQQLQMLQMKQMQEMQHLQFMQQIQTLQPTATQQVQQPTNSTQITPSMQSALPTPPQPIQSVQPKRSFELDSKHPAPLYQPIIRPPQLQRSLQAQYIPHPVPQTSVTPLLNTKRPSPQIPLAPQQPHAQELSSQQSSQSMHLPISPTKLSTPQMQIKQHKEQQDVPPISTYLKSALSHTTSDKFSPQLSQPLVHILPTPLSLAERADKTIENGELETLLVAAPASIVALADLCYLSATSPDFDLKTPLKGFMILKSEKFRPGLHQVVNKASTAFTAANKNVAKIVIHSKQIPPLVMDILHLIVEGEPGDLEMTFPELQQSVIEKATKCIELSNEVAKEFESLFDLLSELNEAFTATSSAQINREGESKSEDSNTQIQKALTDGLLVLNRVRKQWTHLSRFFGELARIIKEETHQPLLNFIEVAQKQSVVKPQDAISAFAKQTLRDQAHKIARKGYTVNSLATTYLEIMKKHLNGPLLTLDQLLAITQKGSGSSGEQMRKDIQLKCEQSQFAIIRIFEDNLSTATKDLEKELEEIGNEKGEEREEDEGEEDPHA